MIAQPLTRGHLIGKKGTFWPRKQFLLEIVHNPLRPLILLMALAALAAAPLATALEEGPVVRAMSYNIRLNIASDSAHAWPHRLDRVVSTIRFHEPDVIGLQEALLDQLEDLETHLPDYSWIGVGREDGEASGEFSAILFREETLHAVDSGTFWLSEAPHVVGSVGWDAALPRIVTWVRFEHRPSGRLLLHVNTHFDHVGAEARSKSAELVVRRARTLAEGQPVIVTGDVNSEPATPPYRHLASSFLDAREVSETPPHGPEGTFSGFVASDRPMPRIDYIFVSSGVRVLRFATLAEHWNGKHGSDHLPVLADLELRTD